MNGVKFSPGKIYSGRVIYCCLVVEFFPRGPFIVLFVVVQPTHTPTHRRSDDDGIVGPTVKIYTFVRSYVARGPGKFLKLLSGEIFLYLPQSTMEYRKKQAPFMSIHLKF